MKDAINRAVQLIGSEYYHSGLIVDEDGTIWGSSELAKECHTLKTERQKQSGSMVMQIFQVQPWPTGIGNAPVGPYQKIEALDELDAATRVLQVPLQSEPRHDMYIRALVRKLGRTGSPIKIYAAVE
jgi:hypothetical protein